MFLLLTLLVHLVVITRGQETPPSGTPGASGATGTAGPVPQGCGITTFTNNSIITSPSYPNDYYSFANCTYTLTAGISGRVHLAFNDFLLESSYDYLTISSGGLDIGRYTGSTKPPTLTLGGSVTLRFTSDLSVEMRGFSISFTTIPANCGELIVSSGIIKSPSYPGMCPGTLQWVWVVVPTPGQSLTLDFGTISVQRNYDWLELYEGNTRVARYTGYSYPPRAILATAGRVVFSTVRTVPYFGFMIFVNSAALTCGGSITGITTISSPKYPKYYPDNALCTWTYRAVPSAVATRLTFTAFDIETDYDLVKIYEGENLRITNTGTQVPKPIELRSDTVTVVFTSDSSGALLGFQLQFAPVF